jgi:hypothetical protein
MEKMNYIDKLTFENVGGGSMVDFIHLKDGRIIGLNDECAVLYNNMQEFWECGSDVKPSFDIPPLRRMTDAQMADLAENAANEAIKHVQDALGVKSGDFAGLYFSESSNWNALNLIIKDYIRAEISEGSKK